MDTNNLTTYLPITGDNFTYIDVDHEREKWMNITGGVCDVQQPNSLLRDPLFNTVIYSIYGVIFCVAFAGNVIVCYIVISSPRMKTVTNYFIMNLAVGDLLVTLLCIPFTVDHLLRQYWVFPEFMCPVVCYVSTLSVFVSAYTLVAISIDKYMLIMWPLKPRISKKSATCIIGMIWLIAGTTGLPTGIFSKLTRPPPREDEPYSYYWLCDRYMCTEDYSNVGGAEWHAHYTTVLMVLQYILPSVVLLFTYTSIGVVIWCHRIPGEAENSRDRRMARSKKKMIKMMVTVVVVYTLCWLPYNVLQYQKILEQIPPAALPYLYFGLHALAMSHSCYNPIIYCYMNARFRDGLCAILQTFPCLKDHVPRRVTGSCSSGLHNNMAKHPALEPTDSAGLQRNNTNSTYVSISGRKNRLSTTCQTQAPVRSASLMRTTTCPNGNNNLSRNKQRSFKEYADEQI